MIEAYTTNVAATPNQVVAFTKTSFQTGCTATVSEDGTTFYLNKPGIYKIEFNACGDATAGGAFGVSATVGNTVIPQSVVSVTTEAAAPQCITFDVLVPVDRVCVCLGGKPVQVTYTGVAGTITIANMIITKIR